MQFEARYEAGITDGSVSLTFRRWKRSQVVAGRRYRTAAGMLNVESVDVVAPDDVTDADAVRAGFPSAAALLTSLRGAVSNLSTCGATGCRQGTAHLTGSRGFGCR